MKRGTSAVLTFLKAFALNLVFQFEWLLLAMVMLLLHFWMQLPLLFFALVLGFWILLALVITWFVSWASECGDLNPGPGAKRTSQRLKEGDCA